MAVFMFGSEIEHWTELDIHGTSLRLRAFIPPAISGQVQENALLCWEREDAEGEMTVTPFWVPVRDDVVKEETPPLPPTPRVQTTTTTTEQEKKPNGRKRPGERVPCPLCPPEKKKTLRDNNALKTHLLTHNDERPFGCSKYVARFRQKAHLQKHEPIHLRPNNGKERKRRTRTSNTQMTSTASSFEEDETTKSLSLSQTTTPALF